MVSSGVYCSLFAFYKPNKICSRLSEKRAKRQVFAPEKLENHISERKGKGRKKDLGGRKEEKRKEQWLHS